MAEALAVAADQRGRTVIDDAVLERIATRAATETSGVVVTGSDLERLIGRRLPKVSARVAGSRATVQVDIAVAWPRPVASVAADVRAHARARLVELTGLAVDRVDVEVVRVVHLAHPERRRV